MNILLLSPHTDDIELGAGGFISKMKRNGNKITTIVFSICKDSIPPGYNKFALKNEFIKSMKILDLKYTILDYTVRKFSENRQEILQDLIKLRSHKPDLIVIPSKEDIHQDHIIIHNESIRCFKSSNIISYELPWNQFSINSRLIVDLSEEDINNKIKMLNCYKTQKNRHYFDKDLIRSLSRSRGIHTSVKYAEVFDIIRWKL